MAERRRAECGYGGDEERRTMSKRRTWRQEMNEAIRRSEQLDILETFSPPRVTETMRKIGELNNGKAIDLTMVDPDDGLPWDLSTRKKRDKLWKIIREEKPRLVIGSPPCTPFSSLQNLTKHRLSREKQEKKEKKTEYGNRTHENDVPNLPVSGGKRKIVPPRASLVGIIMVAEGNNEHRQHAGGEL